MIIFGVICGAFLLGAIPTGLIVARLTRGVDVRKQGSGNVGATNVYRVVGKLPGIFVLAVDVVKGVVPVKFLAPAAIGWGAQIAPETLPLLLGVAAIAGHVWNPFLGFKGGKGVATALGVLSALDLRVGLGVLVVWGIAAFWSRTVSVASIAAAVASPFLMAFLGLPTTWVLGGVGVSLVIIARHRPNILRLLHGEENRIGKQPSS